MTFSAWVETVGWQPTPRSPAHSIPDPIYPTRPHLPLAPHLPPTPDPVVPATPLSPTPLSVVRPRCPFGFRFSNIFSDDKKHLALETLAPCGLVTAK